MNKLTGIDELDIKTIKDGYRFDEKNDCFICMVCGAQFQQGEVFAYDGRFFEAKKAVELHIAEEHGDRFNSILDLKSKYLSLTDNQQELLRMIYSGMSDAEIAKSTETSPSTVRNQRFTFRERAKQAKMYLAIYELATAKSEKKQQLKDKIIPTHEGATMVDDRYVITKQESDKVLEQCFISLTPLKLATFPSKEKRKLVILNKIIEQFEKGREYTEKEINQILKEIFHDYVTLRRYLIEYGFMDRTTNCEKYWLK